MDASRSLWLFGGLRIEVHGANTTITRQRERSLLAFLVLHPDTFHPREKLIELLWPDVLSARAGRNFANVLYRLQQSVGAGLLTVEGDKVAILRSAIATVDTWEF